MSVLRSSSLELRSEHDIVRARQAVRKLAQEYSFSLVDQTKLVTAASELARNTLTHGRGGTVLLEVLAEGARHGIRLRFSDEGPGIADISLAMTTAGPRRAALDWASQAPSGSRTNSSSIPSPGAERA
jgi:serine/threonine-protein kinase RsbT